MGIPGTTPKLGSVLNNFPEDEVGTSAAALQASTINSFSSFPGLNGGKFASNTDVGTPVQSVSSVSEQISRITAVVPPLDMNVYFAQYQMEAMAQARALALAQAHAYESYAVEQAQVNAFSSEFRNLSNLPIHLVVLIFKNVLILSYSTEK